MPPKTSPKKNKRRARPKLGLVLGGGGARGFAHIGIYKVLHDNQIPIDCIAGTSIGAIVGAGIAQKKSPEFIYKIAKEFGNVKHKILRSIRNLGILEGAFISAHDLVGSIQKMVDPDLEFKDLKIPLRVVAVDLETGKPHTLQEGNVLKSILASAAIPGIYPPVFHNSRVFIDGGILNNIPVNVAKEMGADKTVAVNIKSFLSEQYMSAMIYHYYWQRRRETNWGLRIKKFLLKELKMRSKFPIMVMLRSMAISQALSTEKILEEFPPDLIIHPDVSGYGMLEFGSCEKIFNNGVDIAKKNLPEIKNLIGIK